MLRRVTGVDLLRDLSVFFRSLGGMIDGFTERARRVGALLEDPATTFLIVTAPRHDPVEEAIFFHRKLREAGMPFGGLVVNRVHQPPDDAPTLPRDGLGAGAGRARVERRDGELAALAARDAANVARLRAELGDPPTLVVPELDGRRPRPRRSRPRALTPVRRPARRRPPQRGSRWPQSTSRRTARRQPPSSLDERVDLVRRAHEAGHRGALERDRLA